MLRGLFLRPRAGPLRGRQGQGQGQGVVPGVGGRQGGPGDVRTLRRRRGTSAEGDNAEERAAYTTTPSTRLAPTGNGLYRRDGRGEFRSVRQVRRCEEGLGVGQGTPICQ